MDPRPGCNVDVFHLDGSCLVALVGELDLDSVAVVEAALPPLVDRYEARQVVLDCSGLRFIGAVGLDQLVRFSQSFSDVGGQVTLRGTSPLMRRIMAVTNTEEFFEVEGAEDEVSSEM